MHAPNRIAPRAVAANAAALPSEIARISEELFPGPLEARCETDPEQPTEQFLVLTVHADGDPEEVVERRREWHRRVSSINSNARTRIAN